MPLRTCANVGTHRNRESSTYYTQSSPRDLRQVIGTVTVTVQGRRLNDAYGSTDQAQDAHTGSVAARLARKPVDHVETLVHLQHLLPVLRAASRLGSRNSSVKSERMCQKQTNAAIRVLRLKAHAHSSKLASQWRGSISERPGHSVIVHKARPAVTRPQLKWRLHACQGYLEFTSETSDSKSVAAELRRISNEQEFTDIRILHVYKGPRRNESSSRAKAAELAGSCRWDLYEHLVVCGTLQVELLVQICLRHTRAHHEVFLPDRENQARQRPVSDREGIIQKSRNRWVETVWGIMDCTFPLPRRK